MYQPMTELMRRCQDAITECMEAMLVELKRDHSLVSLGGAVAEADEQNLDLEDLTVRNAQFKNFDTIVYMRLRPVWHKVGMKTKIHVQALAELRDLQTWLLEYDSATFAAYINTLQRQHFLAQKKMFGPQQYLHDWFNAPAAAELVSASQLRVSKPKITIEGTASTLIPDGEHHRESNATSNGESAREEFEEEMEAVRELEEARDRPTGGIPETEEDEVMVEVASQMETLTQPRQLEIDDNEEDELQDVTTVEAPPVFRPVVFSLDADLSSRVATRVREGHEPVLEEQPKWVLLAKVLKEIEDTIASVSESHASELTLKAMC